MLRVPNVLVMNAETATRLNIRTVADLIAYAQRPTPASSTTARAATAAPATSRARCSRPRPASLRPHPLRGGNPAQLALLSGQVDFNFDNLATASANIRSGKLKALAVTTAQRISVMPEVPTMPRRAA